MTKELADSELFSIGRAASVVGIAPATLRMWERRYGVPVPVRIASGHRRYTSDQVRWLRRVTEAMSRGTRPGTAICASDAELDLLLAESDPEPSKHEQFDPLMLLACEFRGREAADLLDAECRERGAKHFLLECCAPLITELGRAWADGRLEVRHEHHFTAHLDDLLRAQRRDAAPCPDGPKMLLTTLPGEPHGMGLQMVSLLASVNGVDVRELGTETPLSEIVAAAEETGAVAVGISVSLSTGGPATDRVLAELRAMIPENVRMVVGGAGSRGTRRGPRNIEYADGLDGMDAWLMALVADHAGTQA